MYIEIEVTKFLQSVTLPAFPSVFAPRYLYRDYFTEKHRVLLHTLLRFLRIFVTDLQPIATEIS